MSVRILHLEPDCYPAAVLDRLRNVGAVDLLEGAEPDALLRHLREQSYDAIFTRIGCAMDGRAFALQPALRYVVTPTTGLNHIDLDAAGRRGVRVISLAGETAFLERIPSTAEHTWGLLLSLVRRIPELSGDVCRGRWSRAGRMAEELDGRTLGIVGYGRLGRMVARYGVAFGMRVLAHDRDPGAVDGRSGVESLPLDSLLDASDVISLHITGTPENHGFLDAAKLGRVKPGAVLVNTARGEVVDEAALLASLRSGRLAGAALDVLDGDSAWDGGVPDDHPLVAYAREHPNLILTPHTGGYGRQSIHRTREFVAERFLAILRADTPLTAVPAQTRTKDP